jgi:hypothetical protein
MATSSNSRAQREAELHARRLRQEVHDYRRLLPQNDQVYVPGGVCRADGWDVSYEQLNGEFDLDEALARKLIAGIAGSSGQSLRNVPSPAQSGTDKVVSSVSWFETYLLGDEATPAARTSERLDSELKGAVFGPGNILANVSGLNEAAMTHANVALEKRTTNAVQTAARSIESGAAKSVKINQYMTLYNANKSGKGRPRPRIRIAGMPMQVVKPVLGAEFRSMAYGVNSPLRVSDALKAEKMGKLIAEPHWTAKSLLFSKKTGGILTFAPSAAIDIYNSIELDMSGDRRLNWKKLGIASAKSQSGNLIGAFGAWGGAALAVGMGVGVAASAPVLIVGLFAGIAAQVIWGAIGGADLAEESAKHALEALEK